MNQKENKILKYCSNKRLARILTKASKEDVCRYYIDEDLDRADVFKKLNITASELDVILDYFNIKKDMSTRMKKTRKRQLENMTPEKAAKIKQKELATKAAKSPEAKAHIKNKELETKRKLKEKDPYKYQEIQNRRNTTHSKTLKSKNKEFWLNRYIKFKESIKKSIPESVIKNQETKRKNNTFHTSKVETFVIKYLETLYSIVKQYKSDSYPFNCDIYIKDLCGGKRALDSW